MTQRRGLFLTALILTGASVAAYVAFRGRPGGTDDSGPPALQIASDRLTRTVIVPTVDTPIPEGKSAIWCASFQLAWDQLKEKVAGGPVDIKGAEEATQRLNAAAFDPTALPSGSYYANAGRVSDGIVDTIRRDMAKQFPHKAIPEFDKDAVIIAYAYLQANVRFALPYFDETLDFRDPTGPATKVKAFGLGQKHEWRAYEVRQQVSVLAQTRKGLNLDTFAIDLDKNSHPNQIVIAHLARAGTLLETWNCLRGLPKPDGEEESLIPNDVLLVPTMDWDIDHRFGELENKPVLSPRLHGTYIGKAFQSIRFRLDKSGAELATQAGLVLAPIPRWFLFSRPYLIAMTRRDSQTPFLLMWVDNSELMQPVR